MFFGAVSVNKHASLEIVLLLHKLYYDGFVSPGRGLSDNRLSTLKYLILKRVQDKFVKQGNKKS